MNIDLSSIWSTILSATKSSNSSDKSLGTTDFTSIANSILGNIKANTAAKSGSNSGIDYIAIATQLLTLYNQYKQSSNSDEKAAASNVKGLSSIIGAMGGDKGSIVSAATSILGKLTENNKDDDKDKKGGLSDLAGLFFGK